MAAVMPLRVLVGSPEVMTPLFPHAGQGVVLSPTRRDSFPLTAHLLLAMHWAPVVVRSPLTAVRLSLMVLLLPAMCLQLSVE